MSSLVKSNTKLNLKVFGYFRYNCKLFNVEMLPVDIINIIITYYYFAESLILKGVKKSDGAIIGGDEFVMYRNWHTWCTMWGTNKIVNTDKKVFTWKFCFKSWGKDSIIMIGISNQLSKDLEQNIAYECFAAGESDIHNYFAVSNCGHKYSKTIKRLEENYLSESTDDIFDAHCLFITMILDTTGYYSKLKFYFNNVYTKRCNYNHIEFLNKITGQLNIYRLCISVQLNNIKSVKLLNFSQV